MEYEIEDGQELLFESRTTNPSLDRRFDWRRSPERRRALSIPEEESQPS